jgi:hypothetical protein
VRALAGGTACEGGGRNGWSTKVTKGEGLAQYRSPMRRPLLPIETILRLFAEHPTLTVP